MDLCELRQGVLAGPAGLLLRSVPGGSEVLSVEFDLDTNWTVFSSSESLGVWYWPAPLEEEFLVRLDEQKKLEQD